MKSLLVVVLAILISGTAALAQQKRGTSAEAEALVKKGIAYVKANGKEKALAEINNPKGQFVDRDLYIVVNGLDGKCLANGAAPKMAGMDNIDLKDADGKAFVKERVEIAMKNGKGWQTYRWSNPVTKKIEVKMAYFEKIDDIILGCGSYK